VLYWCLSASKRACITSRARKYPIDGFSLHTAATTADPMKPATCVLEQQAAVTRGRTLPNDIAGHARF